MALIEVNNLRVHFKKNTGILSNLIKKKVEVVHAIDGISFNINKGETFGIVGESGCGKTTTGKALLALLPRKLIKGKISFKGVDLSSYSARELRQFRKDAQIIFQNPITSLNPRMNIGDILAEPYLIHDKSKNKAEIEKETDNLLELVSLSKYEKNKYPTLLSGGQGRRVGIARALALHPQFLVCDEPTSGLDVSISAEIINLMKDIQKQFNLTYLWISHNLRIVSYVSDWIAVMYLGRILEMGRTKKIFENPIHRYSRALFYAGQNCHDSNASIKRTIEGDVPSPINLPTGCRFQARCWDVQSECMQSEPLLSKYDKDHFVACFKT